MTEKYELKYLFLTVQLCLTMQYFTVKYTGTQIARLFCCNFFSFSNRVCKIVNNVSYFHLQSRCFENEVDN